ncbi:MULTISPECIES: DUF1501 domain-containing protein [Burkholderia]|uniref:Twin-arginine translocation pathway signal sequence domain-containing protein n=1 Tax=Burkholderia savannae TaxID=1637837 RepID=A0ABR5TIF2_9BURK|nr:MULTISPECIES: DUF1501 domain-containing protein [Burkholderia]AOJ70782.1 Twin-arginine translocation pathway signal sequence domain-containing protein [Burkholderia savannae]AOK48727.1 Twin-arginine translocation pathway signal sequence domain-containing protein [Burkholderia sp. MSMB617WGS]KVG46759.1 Twin-arginine translocation pathway signal sequence domain-containing protein [Burkholderia sp. MSMB0265]KVG87434.1 Twin-arginine translocation pathway signal sequence domain-containing protein
MKRRDFLALASLAGAAGVSLAAPHAFAATAAAASGAIGAAGAPRAARYSNLLILVELKGGNDGLNTVIPYADPLYRALRPTIGIKREQVVQLDERAALHPALAPLMPIWRDGRLAIVDGVGYPQPNLSHFRSIEIWDTASRADEYLREGWLTRAFAQASVPPGFAADGVVLGSAEMGPLANGARAIALVNPAQFIRAARLVQPVSLREQNPALAHVIDVENDIVKAADRLRPHAGTPALATAFPGGPFGASVKTAMQVLAACDAPQRTPMPGQGVAVLRLTLNGFDTHQNQPGQQAGLLKQLAEGLVAMRSALTELGRWNDTLVMTYAEFGRRARENQSNGTDHGTAAPHFVMGGRVRGGLYGAPPALARLDGNGNLPVAVDFRQLYATVLGPWWGLDATSVLEQRFEPLPLLRA